MPELPEVETTLRGIEPFVRDSKITNVDVRNPSLRWKVPVKELSKLIGEDVTTIERRAKYILIHTDKGTVLLHLGMSGRLRVLDKTIEPLKHDHIDIEFDNKHIVRLNDPRRFGCCLVLENPVESHKLLASLGPEPLSDKFDGEHLFKASRKRTVTIKNFIMDGKVVVGVGNIYASEAMFLSGIRPTAKVNRISLKRYQKLAEAIKFVLAKAIKAGGTTLNDFTQVDGNPGYFTQELQVYGRNGAACNVCGAEIKSKVISQRNTFFCTNCQSF